MDPKIASFITRHRIAVLSVSQADGTVHASTIHYAHTEGHFEIVMLTGDKTRKASNLLTGKPTSAAVTIGFSEEEWVELQMSGEVRLLRAPDYEPYKKVFDAKFRKVHDLGPEDVLLVFTPTWMRYSELKREPKVVIENGK